MAKLTDEQIAFLNHHKVPLEQVFDASGLPNAVWRKQMKEGNYKLAIGVTPCGRAGHTLRDRHNHCIQCDPAQLSYIRRHYAKGIVYVAYSQSLRIVKVGMSERSDRVEQINTYHYGGTSDWVKLRAYACENAGKIETTSHTRLSAFAVLDRTYFKDGREIACDELFSCTIEQAVDVVESSIRDDGQIPKNCTVSVKNRSNEHGLTKHVGAQSFGKEKPSKYEQQLVSESCGYRIGQKVKLLAKPDWGTGIVLSIEGDEKISVDFSNAGKKTLSISHAKLETVD